MVTYGKRLVCPLWFWMFESVITSTWVIFMAITARRRRPATPSLCNSKGTGPPSLVNSKWCSDDLRYTSWCHDAFQLRVDHIGPQDPTPWVTQFDAFHSVRHPLDVWRCAWSKMPTLWRWSEGCVAELFWWGCWLTVEGFLPRRKRTHNNTHNNTHIIIYIYIYICS